MPSAACFAAAVARSLIIANFTRSFTSANGSVNGAMISSRRNMERTLSPSSTLVISPWLRVNSWRIASMFCVMICA
jgi:hypothetical protein